MHFRFSSNEYYQMQHMIYFKQITLLIREQYRENILFNLMTIYVTFFVDRGSGNEKGLLEGKKSNELSLKTDSGNDMGKRSF